MKYRLALAALAVGLSFTTAASAAVFTVFALDHSSNSGMGTGLATLDLTVGDDFTLTVALDDLWSAGALPRWSNANGLTGPLFATGSDESGEAPGTLIGADFGPHTVGGFSAPFGSLVGQIGVGAGSYRLLGTNFSGPAWATGTLKLLYWDSNVGDNTGSILANLVGPTAVAEPATWAMMIGGFGMSGAILRRRRAAPA